LGGLLLFEGVEVLEITQINPNQSGQLLPSFGREVHQSTTGIEDQIPVIMVQQNDLTAGSSRENVHEKWMKNG